MTYNDVVDLPIYMYLRWLRRVLLVLIGTHWLRFK